MNIAFTSCLDVHTSLSSFWMPCRCAPSSTTYQVIMKPVLFKSSHFARTSFPGNWYFHWTVIFLAFFRSLAVNSKERLSFPEIFSIVLQTNGKVFNGQKFSHNPSYKIPSSFLRDSSFGNLLSVFHQAISHVSPSIQL